MIETLAIELEIGQPVLTIALCLWPASSEPPYVLEPLTAFGGDTLTTFDGEPLFARVAT
jgi:hypothetical protein